ncbi:hypothetical protein SD80_012655 [Scytonema tolypothrichoides VB-61278]|nr:hypothetical protein SD80_012655 [Scytonema tolypothrichoides VB-61278]
MTGHVFIWGWLRIFLGITQTVLAATGVLMFLSVGSRPITLIVIGGALSATIISRLLYKGKSDPRLS